MTALHAAAYAAPREVGETVDYVVQSGDTLIGVRDRLLRPGADWRVLQRLNRVAVPRRLAPGRTLRLPVALLREQAAVAEVVHVHGDVSVSRAGAALAPLLGGSTLADGDVVTTGRQASATLRFADGSRVLVRPASELRLERLTRSADGHSASTRLRLEQGSADSRVTPPAQPGDARARRYEIRTPVANLGVRGTEFRSQLGDSQLRVEVLEGRVGAAVGKNEVAVAAGFGAIASATQTRTQALLGAPDLRGLSTRIERLPLALAWPALAGAVAYRAQILAPDQPDALLLDGRFGAAQARYADDLPDGRYLLRVRGIDDSGLEGRDAQASFTLKARPEPPFSERPRAGATAYEETVEFTWSRNPAAARYRLQVATSADFATPLHDRSDIGATEVRLALPPGSYQWRLASIRADGDQGPFGDAQSLLRRPPPPSPPPAPPEATDGGLRLRWRASDEPGASYAYQLARDAAFTQIVQEARTSEAQVLLRDPAPGIYYLRVRSLAADGFAGPYGSPQQIEVPGGSKWWWLLLPALLLLL